MSFFALGSKDIGMDLGTSNILITLKGKGIVLNEPAVVTIERRSNEIVATGNEAKLSEQWEQGSLPRSLKEPVVVLVTTFVEYLVLVFIEQAVTAEPSQFNSG